MRKGEIQHAQKSWFRLDSNPPVVVIPGREIQNLKSGKHEWRTKDGETRHVPLSEAFCAFLGPFLTAKKQSCLESRISKNGLLDFRLPFERYAKLMGREDMTIHAMRHSWISSLCNSGHATITQVAAWSGDRIETIENTYWKKRVTPEALTDTLSGKKVGQEAKEMRKMLEEIKHDLWVDREWEEWRQAEEERSKSSKA